MEQPSRTFHRRSEAGRTFFHGPEEPDDADAPGWVHALAESVAGNMTSIGGPARIGFLYSQEEGLWEDPAWPPWFAEPRQE